MCVEIEICMEGKNGCSAIHVIDVNNTCYISKNKEAYWVSGCLFDFSFKIGKDSPEFSSIENILKTFYIGSYDICAIKRELEGFFDRLVLKHITPKQLKTYIESVKLDAFLDGKKAKQEEIRKCLGVE